MSLPRNKTVSWERILVLEGLCQHPLRLIKYLPKSPTHAAGPSTNRSSLYFLYIDRNNGRVSHDVYYT